jgi:uncharacterized membrane protein
MTDTASNPWYSNVPFLCIVVMGTLLALACTFFVVPYMTTAPGYNPDVFASSGPNEATVFKMKVALVEFQCVGLVLAIATMWLHLITRQRVEETERKLRGIISKIYANTPSKEDRIRQDDF